MLRLKAGGFANDSRWRYCYTPISLAITYPRDSRTQHTFRSGLDRVVGIGLGISARNPMNPPGRRPGRVLRPRKQAQAAAPLWSYS